MVDESQNDEILNLPSKISDFEPSQSQGYLVPKDFSEALRISEFLSQVPVVPKDYQGKPANILIAIQWGLEIGLHPLQSLNSIAVINGRASIYGDAALALVWGSGLCLAYDDTVEGPEDNIDLWEGIARSLRKNTPNPIERRFSVADAKRANLWGKKGPWTEYPRRMLVQRARGFLLRDLYPDVLRGIITHEELQDQVFSEETKQSLQLKQNSFHSLNPVPSFQSRENVIRHVPKPFKPGG